MKALFLDRDGTLIEYIPYLSNPNLVKLMPYVQEVLFQAIIHNYYLFLFTNQSGISRGLYTLHEVIACNKRMFQLLKLPKPGFTEVCIAPEHPEGPLVYRKPSPKFILEMIKKYKLKKSQCYMIGDSIYDLQAGLKAGIKTVTLVNQKLENQELIPSNITKYESIYNWFKEIRK